MDKSTATLKKVNKFLYPFGRKTSIKSKLYPAYYRAWLLSQIGIQVTAQHILHELKITNEHLERQYK